MSKNSSIYTLLWFLIQLIIEIHCQTKPFKPLSRYRHTATLIDGKLYVLGGLSDLDDITGSQFFYLDVSGSFNTQELLWYDLTNINYVPCHGKAESVTGGTNKDTLYLYGGEPTNYTEKMD